jgi:signal transduction histidine kinase
MQKSGGVGLISMRERMHLAGGALEIASIPGHGTTLHVRVSVDGKAARHETYNSPEATSNGHRLTR